MAVSTMTGAGRARIVAIRHGDDRGVPPLLAVDRKVDLECLDGTQHDRESHWALVLV
jgi:hypothetical protein